MNKILKLLLLLLCFNIQSSEQLEYGPCTLNNHVSNLIDEAYPKLDNSEGFHFPNVLSNIVCEYLQTPKNEICDYEEVFTLDLSNSESSLPIVAALSNDNKHLACISCEPIEGRDKVNNFKLLIYNINTSELELIVDNFYACHCKFIKWLDHENLILKFYKKGHKTYKYNIPNNKFDRIPNFHIKVSPDKTKIAKISLGIYIEIIENNTKTILAELECNDFIACFAWSHDSKKIAIGGVRYETIAIFDAESYQLLDTIEDQESKGVTNLSWSPDDSTLISTSHDTVKCWQKPLNS